MRGASAINGLLNFMPLLGKGGAFSIARQMVIPRELYEYDTRYAIHQQPGGPNSSITQWDRVRDDTEDRPVTEKVFVRR